MTTESASPQSTYASSAGEILRLRQQLAAREEVISQLNRRLIGQPDTGHQEEPEPDPDVLAAAIVNGRALEAELHTIRQVVAQQRTEIVALRHQLGVYDRLGMSSAVGGLQKVWSLLRRAGGRT
jgi:uncharacterized coiled-coil protein SlyX